MKTLKHDPYAALRYPEFVLLITATNFITAHYDSGSGHWLRTLQTNPRPAFAGFYQLGEALPYISVALFGGHYADRKDKRTMMQISQSVILCCSLGLLWLMSYNLSELPRLPYYWQSMAF
ncbi:MAG: hypothetical protein R2822_10930 [Spirosomataceae bacterium]